MTSHLRVLTVLSDLRLWKRLRGILSRRQIEVNRVPSGAGALILTGNLSYDLIIIEHPLPDLALGDFLASIRTLDSTSTNSPVLLLTDPGEHPEIPEADTELVRSLPKNADEAEFHAAVSTLLGVAARFAARVMVQLEVGLETGISTRLYQAENLSETGLLLRGGRHIPIGTPVRFEFSLPSEVDSIAGIGLVVRHTSPTESTPGIALQFAELGVDHLQRLKRFTAADAAAPSSAASSPAPEEGAENSAQA